MSDENMADHVTARSYKVTKKNLAKFLNFHRKNDFVCRHCDGQMFIMHSPEDESRCSVGIIAVHHNAESEGVYTMPAFTIACSVCGTFEQIFAAPCVIWLEEQDLI